VAAVVFSKRKPIAMGDEGSGAGSGKAGDGTTDQEHERVNA
jgi:hypothetical protein